MKEMQVNGELRPGQAHQVSTVWPVVFLRCRATGVRLLVAWEALQDLSTFL